MIDIHSHILPAVDDGARTVNEALDMLRIAVDNGVTTQVLTPHIHLDRFSNSKASIQIKFEAFKKIAETAAINVQLLLGAELRIGGEIIQLALQDNIPCLGQSKGKKVFLLEFPRTELPHGSVNVVKWLISNDYLPIIVHPERNKVFVEQPNILQAFINLACPLQITASSLLGKFGRDAQKMSERLLIADQVSVIASDCHNLKGRSPDLLAGLNKATSIIGEEKSVKLVSDNPHEYIQKNAYLQDQIK